METAVGMVADTRIFVKLTRRLGKSYSKEIVLESDAKTGSVVASWVLVWSRLCMLCKRFLGQVAASSRLRAKA